MDFAPYIRTVPDFPIPGVLFRDITTLTKDAEAFRAAVDSMVQLFADVKVDKVAGVEARGWIFAPPMAYNMGAGFVAVRKPNKLPAETIQAEYSLEYGINVLQMHKDALCPGERVLIIDDLLATGGTARAAITMAEELGAVVVGVGFLIELKDLKGRVPLAGYDVRSVLCY